jgi:hypothetical protein
MKPAGNILSVPKVNEQRKKQVAQQATKYTKTTTKLVAKPIRSSGCCGRIS